MSHERIVGITRIGEWSASPTREDDGAYQVFCTRWKDAKERQAINRKNGNKRISTRRPRCFHTFDKGQTVPAQFAACLSSAAVRGNTGNTQRCDGVPLERHSAASHLGDTDGL